MAGSDFRPALIGSAILHAAVLAGGFAAWRTHEPAPEKLVTSVPVTLVSAPVAVRAASAPARDRGPAEPSPLVAPPEPTPAPPWPSAARPPPSQPTPAPQTPPLRPPPGAARPQPQKPVPKPAPQRPPAREEPSLDLDELSKQIARNAPRRPRAPTPTPDAAGSGGASPQELADARSALAARLVDAWNPNCQVEGGSRINVKVRFRLGENGRVAGGPDPVGGDSGEPLVRAAQDRAVRAVLRLQPYDWMPKEALNETYTINFDAQRACSR